MKEDISLTNGVKTKKKLFSSKNLTFDRNSNTARKSQDVQDTSSDNQKLSKVKKSFKTNRNSECTLFKLAIIISIVSLSIFSAHMITNKMKNLNESYTTLFKQLKEEIFEIRKSMGKFRTLEVEKTFQNRERHQIYKSLRKMSTINKIRIKKGIMSLLLHQNQKLKIMNGIIKRNIKTIGTQNMEKELSYPKNITFYSIILFFVLFIPICLLYMKKKKKNKVSIPKSPKAIERKSMKNESGHPEKQKDSTIKINLWNCRYLNTTDSQIRYAKTTILKTNNPDLILINEANIKPSFLNYKSYSETTKTRNGEKCNVCILIKEQMEHELVRNIDDNIIYIKVKKEIGFLHVLLFYGVKDLKERNKAINKLNMLVKNIQKSESNPKLFVAGDFNIHIQKIKNVKNKPLLKLLKNLRYDRLNHFTFKRRSRGRVISKRNIDHTFTNNLKTKAEKIPGSLHLSDHLAFSIKIRGIRLSKRTRMKIPNKATAIKIEKEVLELENPNIFLYTEILKKHKDKTCLYQTSTTKISKKIAAIIQNNDNIPKIRELMKNNFLELAHLIEKNRFSNKSKLAFTMMKKIFKYNGFQKAGGSIVNRLKEKGKTITNYEEINKRIILHYKNNHKADQTPKFRKYFPQLQTPSKKLIKEICYRMSINKAFVFDGMHDGLFRIHPKCQKVMVECEECTKKICFLKTVWNKKYWESTFSKTHLESRLLPLNKNHPEVATIDKYRPIVIMSPMIKFCESRIIQKLKNYCKNKINPEQVGFVEGMSTQVNLFRIGEKIFKNKLKKRGKKTMFLLFLDLKSAYDLVNRTMLYGIIKNQNILDAKELQMLKFFHSNMVIKLGNSICYTETGVPQGSAVSPLLFNIYIDKLLSKIKGALGESIDCYGFADDILISSHSLGSIQRSIALCRDWCKEFSMSLNEKKSGILIMDDRTKTYSETQSIMGIPVVESYKYLGVWLNKDFGMKENIESIKKKTGFIKSRLGFLFSKNSLKFRRNCFEIFVSPLFLNLIGIYFYSRTPEKTKIKNLWKKCLKKFLGLRINTDDKIINVLKPYDLNNKAVQTFKKYKKKIRERLNDNITNKPILSQKCLRNRNIFFEKHKIEKEEMTWFTKIWNLCGRKSKALDHRLKYDELEKLLNMSTPTIAKAVLSPNNHKELVNRMILLKEKNLDQIINMYRESLSNNTHQRESTPEDETAIRNRRNHTASRMEPINLV